jgi:hypothetical protein
MEVQPLPAYPYTYLYHKQIFIPSLSGQQKCFSMGSVDPPMEHLHYRLNFEMGKNFITA